MEIGQYFATLAEFLDYSLHFLYAWLSKLFDELSGQVPSWFFACAILSVSVGLMRKVNKSS